MSKRIMILGCLLFLGSVGTSQATPLDSPDVVYVDGLPCNRFCQSYLAWSQNRSSGPREQPAVPHEQPASAEPAQLPPKRAAHRATATRQERSKPAAQVRVTKQAAPASIKMPPAKPADAQPAAKTGTDSDSAQAKIVETPPASEAAPGSDAEREKIADSPPAGDAAGSNTRAIAIAAPESIEMPQAKPADVQPAAKTAADSDSAQAKIVESNPASEAAAGSDATPEKIADSSSAGDAAGSNTSAIQEQVTAATAVARQMTVATVVPEAEPRANDTNRSDRAETAMLGDAEKTGSTPPNDTDLLVAVLMARPEITSVSDLTNKDIAIDGGEAVSNGSVRTAIAAAGATEVQLSEAQTRAIDRLISGDVPAAVLALVSPEAAEGFPEIAGFKIFRIPLSPRALKARL